MDCLLFFHTLRHLRLRQILYRLLGKLWHPKYKETPCPDKARKLRLSETIDKAVCLKGNSLTFLNLRSVFKSWNDTDRGLLWAYNLNYMDWLCQGDITAAEGARWIETFIAGLPENNIGLEAYPTALRGLNWMKFITRHYDETSPEQRRLWNDSLYSQYALLRKKPEYHLSGNHLLEDAFSMFAASIYFFDSKLFATSARLLRRELDEQILADGAHFEQSPMYHCIMLDRLLDCYNFSLNNPLFPRQEDFTGFLGEKARRMLGHLESIVYPDMSIPLLNDSAKRIAPEPGEIFEYARRLGLNWSAVALRECGYRRFSGYRMEAVVDAADIMASYQAGHSHADTFNFELRVDGRPFIVDTGISTYDKNPRRQLERGTAAHNTVTVAGRDSSEVWGGFRMGRRARVKITKDASDVIEACHDGFGKKLRHTRGFRMGENSFEITDTLPEECGATCRIHFAPEVRVLSLGIDSIMTDRAVIAVEGASSVEIADCTVSTEYNSPCSAKAAEISFSNRLVCKISL